MACIHSPRSFTKYQIITLETCAKLLIENEVTKYEIDSLLTKLGENDMIWQLSIWGTLSPQQRLVEYHILLKRCEENGWSVEEREGGVLIRQYFKEIRDVHKKLKEREEMLVEEFKKKSILQQNLEASKKEGRSCSRI